MEETIVSLNLNKGICSYQNKILLFWEPVCDFQITPNKLYYLREEFSMNLIKKYHLTFV